MKRNHVRIAVPTMHRQVSSHVAHFLAGVTSFKSKTGGAFDFSVNMVNGCYPIPYARNTLVRNFLQSDATHLWFIDSDVVPAPNSLELLTADADIAAGTYPSNTPSAAAPIRFHIFKDNLKDDTWNYVPINPFESSGFVECDAVATGMMLIRRHVLEDPKMRLLPDTDAEPTRTTGDHPFGPAIFREIYGHDGRVDVSDDLDFCRRAKANGYRIVCHTGVICGHIKEWDILDVWNYMSAAHAAGIAYAQEKSA